MLDVLPLASNASMDDSELDDKRRSIATGVRKSLLDSTVWMMIAVVEKYLRAFGSELLVVIENMKSAFDFDIDLKNMEQRMNTKWVTKSHKIENDFLACIGNSDKQRQKEISTSFNATDSFFRFRKMMQLSKLNVVAQLRSGTREWGVREMR